MKTKALILFTSVALHMASYAEEIKTIELKDGASATIIYRSGTTKQYIKALEKSSSDKSVLIPGQAFDGTQIARRDNGQCVKVVDRLLRLEDVSTAAGTTQVPVMQREEAASPCPDAASSTASSL